VRIQSRPGKRSAISGVQISIRTRRSRFGAARARRLSVTSSRLAQRGGEQQGSFCTPRGEHIVRAKIGASHARRHRSLSGRRPTGEIWTPEMAERFPGRDWILTRILWLSGREAGEEPAARGRHHAALHLHSTAVPTASRWETGFDWVHTHAQPGHRGAFRARAAWDRGQHHRLKQHALVRGFTP